ncbi:MAG: hypothetical protein ACOX67_02715 [Oscillospiraceae bacterium]|jgi:uncharacterized membrane protein HdeD (DUF308 family)
MRMTAALLVPALLIYLAIPTAVLSVAEYFLAKLESPWPGRVLPILSALCSVCIGLILLFNLLSTEIWAAVLGLGGGLIILNVPTLIYLLIYRHTRRKCVEKKNLDRMNIQDL